MGAPCAAAHATPGGACGWTAYMGEAVACAYIGTPLAAAWAYHATDACMCAAFAMELTSQAQCHTRSRVSIDDSVRPEAASTSSH